MLSEKARHVIAIVNNWNPCLEDQETRFLHTPYQTLSKHVRRHFPFCQLHVQSYHKFIFDLSVLLKMQLIILIDITRRERAL